MRLDFHDQSIIELASGRAKALEEMLRADVLFYSGWIEAAHHRFFRDYVEDMKRRSARKDGAVALFLRTGGGIGGGGRAHGHGA